MFQLFNYRCIQMEPDYNSLGCHHHHHPFFRQHCTICQQLLRNGTKRFCLHFVISTQLSIWMLIILLSANGVIWRQRGGTYFDRYPPKPTPAARRWTSGSAPPSRSSRLESSLNRIKLDGVVSGHRLHPHFLRGARLRCRHKGHHTLHDQSDQAR